MLFDAGLVKTVPNPGASNVGYVIEVARDMNGNPVNAYRAKVQAVIPGNNATAYRAFSASSVADGTP